MTSKSRQRQQAVTSKQDSQFGDDFSGSMLLESRQNKKMRLKSAVAQSSNRPTRFMSKERVFSAKVN